MEFSNVHKQLLWDAAMANPIKRKDCTHHDMSPSVIRLVLRLMPVLWVSLFKCQGESGSVIMKDFFYLKPERVFLSGRTYFQVSLSRWS